MPKTFRLLLILSMLLVSPACAAVTPSSQPGQPLVEQTPTPDLMVFSTSPSTPTAGLEILNPQPPTDTPTVTTTLTATLTATLTSIVPVISTQVANLTPQVAQTQPATPVPPTAAPGNSSLLREKHSDDPCT